MIFVKGSHNNALVNKILSEDYKMKGTISFKKPIGYLSQVDYNYCEDKLKRDDRQILEELKDIPKEKYEQL